MLAWLLDGHPCDDRAGHDDGCREGRAKTAIPLRGELGAAKDSGHRIALGVGAHERWDVDGRGAEHASIGSELVRDRAAGEPPALWLPEDQPADGLRGDSESDPASDRRHVGRGPRNTREDDRQREAADPDCHGVGADARGGPEYIGERRDADDRPPGAG